MRILHGLALLSVSLAIGPTIVVGRAGEQPATVTLTEADRESFSVREEDITELLSELDKAIKQDEQRFVPEKDTEDFVRNWRTTNRDIYTLARYLLIADPARAAQELLSRFNKTQFSTTRWSLSWGLRNCGNESVLVALGDACRQEKYSLYRLDLLDAYVRCDALCRLRTYSEVLPDNRPAVSGEYAGGVSAIGTSSNLATRELARLVKLGPSVGEKDGGLDIDRNDADRWRAWFAQNGPYLRLATRETRFLVDEEAKACAVPLRDWDRLSWESKSSLAKKAGKSIPEEVRGETVAGKVARLSSYMEKCPLFVDRRSAAVRLGFMGADARAAIPVIEKQLVQEENQSVRKAIKTALERLKESPKPLHTN
jgi:hypothetical protein